jgi:hypothetical protein
MVRLPSGSYCFAILWAPWFSKSAVDLSVWEEGKCFTGLTFACNREEDQTARFANIRGHEVLDEIDVGGVSTLADAGDKTFSGKISSTNKWGERGGDVPGKSQNDKSVSSGPHISRDTQFFENVSSR